MNTKAAVSQVNVEPSADEDKGEVSQPVAELTKTETQAAVSAVVQNPKGNEAMATKAKIFNESRYLELRAKDDTPAGLSDAETEEYLELYAARRESQSNSRKEFEAMVDAFSKSSVTFADFYREVVKLNDGKRAEIGSLFTAAEIKAAAAGKKVPKKGATRIQKVKDEADLVISYKLEGAKGRGLKITKDELLNPKPATYAIASLKKIATKDVKTFVAKLRAADALKNDFEELYKSDEAFKTAVANLFNDSKTKSLAPKSPPAA